MQRVSKLAFLCSGATVHYINWSAECVTRSRNETTAIFGSVNKLYGERSAAAAASSYRKNLIIRLSYQLWYSGPSLYSTMMFALLLEASTYNKYITLPQFISLFTLIQSMAAKMTSFPTFLGNFIAAGIL